MSEPLLLVLLLLLYKTCGVRLPQEQQQQEEEACQHTTLHPLLALGRVGSVSTPQAGRLGWPPPLLLLLLQLAAAAAPAWAPMMTAAAAAVTVMVRTEARPTQGCMLTAVCLQQQQQQPLGLEGSGQLHAQTRPRAATTLLLLVWGCRHTQHRGSSCNQRGSSSCTNTR
jgi:hypothetical protein